MGFDFHTRWPLSVRALLDDISHRHQPTPYLEKMARPGCMHPQENRKHLGLGVLHSVPSAKINVQPACRAFRWLHESDDVPLNSGPGRATLPC